MTELGIIRIQYSALVSNTNFIDPLKRDMIVLRGVDTLSVGVGGGWVGNSCH